ncbi:MAG: recombinase family protein [Candidatus Adlerbacteria bacterium]
MKANITYASYARKSSEAEDKQALSIESQADALKRLAKNKEVDLKEENILEESHSAKQAFARPVFERLLKEIESRKVQGILAWHPNRLSRNAIDAARLIQLMDEEKLIEILTPSQTFKNTPQDKFFFQMMTSQAKMENDTKGIEVRRGLRKKNQMGFPGGVAKPGYENDYGLKGQRKIIVDLERFELVKQMFKLFLSGKYSVRKLTKYAEEVMGLRSIQRTKEGGKPLALSRVYAILQDPFYAGFFYGKDEDRETVRYEVNEALPRMITEEEYWEIQAMLGRKGVPRPTINKRIFPYTGRTKCGTCGGSVTAEHKHQLICSECKYKFAYQNKTVCPTCETKISDMDNAVYLHYIYYHCTKKRSADCPEGSVQEFKIDDSMAEYAENNFTISKSLSDWCIQHLDELAKNDKQNEYERKGTWERELAQKEKESEELVRMRIKGLITDDAEFFKHKATLEADKKRIKQVLTDMGGTDMTTLEKAKEAFSLVVGVAEVFRKGTFDEKQEALSALGSNLTLKDKKLNVINKEIFSVITKGLLEAKAVNKAFEPKNCEADKDETEVFTSVRPTMLRDQDSNLEPTPYT